MSRQAVPSLQSTPPFESTVYRSNSGGIRAAKLGVYAVLAIGAIVMFFPFFWSTLSAFKQGAEINALPPVVFPSQPTLDNFTKVFERIAFLRMAWNSLWIAAVMTAVPLYTSALLGYVLAKYAFWGRNVLFIYIIATLMIPTPVTLVPLYQVCLKLGLINNYGALIVPGIFWAYGIFLQRQAMYAIPNELIDAARIDGAGEFRIFHRIVLPNVHQVLAAQAILAFLGQWNNFLWPLITLQDERLYTLPLGLAYFSGQWWNDTGPMLAGTMLATVPTLILFVLFQRQITEGLTMTGIK